MTPKQIELVRKSFDALWPFRRKLAEQFYGRFFELAPDTRRLFPNDMERQQLKLMDTIAAIVGTLDERELFQSIISHTGRKHADFGVQTSHFTAFGEALILAGRAISAHSARRRGRSWRAPSEPRNCVKRGS